MPTKLPADIEGEFAILRDEASLLSEVLSGVDAELAEQSRARRWIHTVGVAATIEKMYSGCERVLLLIASRVDRSPIPRDDGWHAALLNRMVEPFPGVRAQ